MKIKDENKIKAAFIALYKGQQAPVVSRSWDREVMDHVRRIGLCGRPPFFRQFEKVIWRFAPVALLLIIVLTIYLTQTDFIPEQDIASLLMNDPIGFVLMEYVAI